MALNVLSLPPEIILKVASRLENAHKKSLRLVCRTLNETIESEVFANLVLRYSVYQPELICDLLEALATKTTNVGGHVRSLEIRGFSPDPVLAARSRSRSVERSAAAARGSRSRSRGPLAEAHLANQAIRTHLRKAVSSLVNVQDVYWYFGDNDPDWAKTVVIESLATLPILQDLTIYLGGGPTESLRLELLKDLRRVTISGTCEGYRTSLIPSLRILLSNSPNLTYLDTNNNHQHGETNIPTLHDLFDGLTTTTMATPCSPRRPGRSSSSTRTGPLEITELSLRGWCVRLDDRTIPHLRALQSFRLYNNIDPEYESQSITTDEIARDQFLDQYGSYSSSDSEVWDALRKEGVFLTEIVTDHVSEGLLDYLASFSGLKTLNLVAAATPSLSKSRWEALAGRFFNEVLPHHVETLEELEVKAVFEGRWCFNELYVPTFLRCLKLKSLSLSIDSHHINRKSGKDIVHTLLGVSEQLPSLTHLFMASADSPTNGCGHGSSATSIKHLYTVNMQISKSVTTYGPLDPSGLAKVVSTPARDYVARADESCGGGLWYRSSMRHGSRLEL